MDRYYIYSNDDARIKKEIDKDGDWVRYEDAAARIAELEAEIVERRKDYSACIRDQDARIAELEAQLAAAQERERVLNDDLKFALELAVAYAPNIKDQEWAAELIEQMDSPTPSQEADDEQD